MTEKTAEEFLANQHEIIGGNLVTNEIAANNEAAGELNTSTSISRIISIFELLKDPTLAIPQYQRPYKWTAKNINQLFSDIAVHKDKTAYRLGTIVFHKDKDKENGKEVKNIVDGQQRTISLMLAAVALIKRNKKEKFKQKHLSDAMDQLQNARTPLSFESEISQTNIYNNYQEIDRLVSHDSFTEEHIDFFLHKCEVVTVTLTDVSEAFQFFDSQNARGRDLEPHDLLKAYHLREFGPGDEHLRATAVARWENNDTQALATLFSQYLYRIRNWSKGASARYFSKADIDLFKGVNIDTAASYPYVEQLRITHHYVDNYNGQYERKIDGRHMEFPFHIDQIIINGQRFFELTAHYQEKVQAHYQEKVQLVGVEVLGKHGLASEKSLDGYAAKILETINTYDARHRTGDRYVRMIFDCLLIYYIDKFGYAEISRAIEKIFIWAYSLRLQMKVVQLATMDNHVLNNNLFSTIKEATCPIEFTLCSLSKLKISNSTKKTSEIEKIFKDMKYYE